MKNNISIQKQTKIRGTVKYLPASKSISNRVLILNALSGNTSTLHNLSEANDTRLMRELLETPETILNVEDAGTTMRFLTAFCSATNQQKVITGTDRMKQRPIKLLVDALKKLGVSIDYMENDGFPPVKVNGFAKQLTDTISIKGDVSSQYISALMMVAPSLPLGLTIQFEGKVTSKPYLEMTASLMRQFGIDCQFSEHGFTIKNQPYKPTTVTVEADWSAISYWLAFAALSQESEILLPNVTLKSLQGDKAIVDIMEPLGVKCEPRGNNLLLIMADHHNDLTWDFTHCPDLAQTVSVVCAAKGIKGTFTGLQSLRIKETDRIKALQQELAKFGASLLEENETWTLIPATNELPSSLSFETYLDHRMAMAFAPLATRTNVTLNDPNVVRKSYPRFWEDVRGVGFKVELEGQ